MMNHIPDVTKMVGQPRQFADDRNMVKCPHCNKECKPDTPEAGFIGWHGLCAECELNGVNND